MANLTDNDKYVLNAMFNPNYPLDFDQNASSDANGTSTDRKRIPQRASAHVSLLARLVEIQRLEEEGTLHLAVNRTHRVS